MPTYKEDRAHFGAWCIVSAPLILGYDVNNSAISDAVWPIITNRHAIAVNQAWAGHPGSLVDSYAVPSANETYLWGVNLDSSDQTQLNWAFPTGVTPAPISKDGQCVDFSVGKPSEEIQLAPCTGSDNQNFALESNGNLHAVSGSKACLAIGNLHGPAVVSFACNTGSNEVFAVNRSAGTVCSHNGYCLASRSTPPGSTGADAIQVWAKPMGVDSVAIFVINNDPQQTLTVDVHLTKANLTRVPSSVFDVWQQTPAAGATSLVYQTDPIEAHDSRFYIFSA